MPTRPTRELYEKVNELPAEQVAEVLGLTRARERHKYNCPVHGGSDSLHAYRGAGGGFYCWGACQCAYSNVDLAMHAWGLEHGDACQRLADQCGVITPSAPTFQSGRASTRRPATPGARGGMPPFAPRPKPIVEPAALGRLRADGIIPQLPPVVYGAVLEALALTSDGTTYLRSRGLDPDSAADYGFRSIDGSREWTALGDALAGTFLAGELEAANFYRTDSLGAEPARWAPPWGGRAPALLIPYRVRGDVVGIQLRDMRVAVQKDKYRTEEPPGAALPPFNADALLTCAGEAVHVAEGELNAFTLMSAGAIAVGLKSALWPDAWTSTLEHVRRLVVWFDADQASDPKAATFAGLLQARFGSTWLRERTRRVPLPLGADGKNLDANDLHLRGVLRDYIARAAG